MTQPLLEVDGLEAGYEMGSPIVRGVSLRILPGEIVAVLGPNGAGKSTLIKAIAGLVAKFGGHVRLGQRDITGVPAHELSRNGLAFVPQTENIFALMSIADNLRLASDVLPRHERRGQIDAMYALFPDLDRQRLLLAGRLSGGQRQMLAVARALIAKPRLLMLDEASAGLSPKVVGQVFSKLIEIAASGIAILLVEQNTRAALAVATRAIILVEGKTVHEGPANMIAGDAAIGRLYLGLRPVDGAA